MTNFAYLRVSSDGQDIKNQKLGLLEYCNNHNITPLKFVEDISSGKINWRERAIGNIIEKAQGGDIIAVSEISRLGRSTLQVLEILELAAKKGISVHIAKNHIVMDGSMQATITATILGLAAQIEREFISCRTKEALAKRKKDGIKLGRPKGQAQFLKLDNYRDEILKYLHKGINKRAISKLIECSPATLYEWLKRRKSHS
ncbi:Site-specific recombinase, resolvase family protein [Candidatus Phycorickettsia trachydisci]|uniref:Site-specific recombinase, resolvase family protein n=1 Tax=Candidatus Phycorickettsia trachydisci TaxID=2115978 RepID=A0A2P1P9I9_9RICK|nr:recombinase family protein [Candidatus Phycorickettsia trachydisci]AVP87938.1 Site-specific recombinase, resolvase family protein [Candidatus Phycorickettsia trachydisci]